MPDNAGERGSASDVDGAEAGSAPALPQAQIIAAHLAMLSFAFLVSTSFTVGAAITDTLDPAVLTFLRMVIASVILMGLLVVQTGRFRAPAPSAIAGYLWLALLLCVFFVAMFTALRLTSPLAAGAVITLVPPITALWSRLILGQSLSGYQWGTLIIAAFAALWVVARGDLARLAVLGFGKGEVIFFFGCTAYAAYSPSVRKLHGARHDGQHDGRHDGRSLLEMTAWVMAGSVALLGVYARREIIATHWSALPLTTYLGVTYLAVFTTAISFYLMQFATLRLPSAKVMAYTYLIPALVLAQNVLLGSSLPPPSVLAGVLVIASAVFLLQRSARWS